MIGDKPESEKRISRYGVLYIILFAILTVIVLKLMYLQFLNYNFYKEKANDTSTKFVAERAPRGKIYDRNGVVLATNEETYIVTYTETEESAKNFYKTLNEFFKILDENNETYNDTFNLKVNADGSIFYQYLNNEKELQDAEELRFKKDRGLNAIVEKKLFDNAEELTEEQSDKVDAELLKMSPEDSFYNLVKTYNLIEMADENYAENKKIYKDMSGKELAQKILDAGYSLQDIRRFMVVKDLIKMQGFRGSKSVTIASSIERNTALVLFQRLNDLPGLDVSECPIRYYPYGSLASSVLGYVSTINSSQKEQYELRGYDVSSDLIGKAGIESAFEDVLKGTKGGSTVKVNAQGRITSELFKIESAPGNDVHLSIDAKIQYAAEQSLADKMVELQTMGGMPNATRGAVIAVDVKTGKVLALASGPNYDPNLFTVPGELSTELTKQYFNPDLDKFGTEFIQRMGLKKNLDQLFSKNDGVRSDPYDLYPKPFYNYATMSLIPPGSTFKPLSAVAGLESGVINPGTIIVDKGEFKEHPETFGAAFNPSSIEYRQYHYALGPVSLTKAIAESVNYYFYEIAYRMYIKEGSNINALDSLAQYAWQFGLGCNPDESKTKSSTGIEISENFGQTYNFKSWKKNVKASALFYLVDYLERGYYPGNGSSFVAFDIKINEDDPEDVAALKKKIKQKVLDTLDKVGTDQEVKNIDGFAKEIKPDVLQLMNKSQVYKARVAQYESKGAKVNYDAQASIIANNIAAFTISDKGTEIKSPGQIVYASIGQGMNNFTPAQLAAYITALSNGGTRYKLSLVNEVTDSNGKIIRKYEPEVLNTISMSESTKNAVRQGMTAVNNEEGGTASSVFKNFPINTAGKTGTADAREDQTEVGRQPYATYVSYAPAEDPEIAVVAVIFDGGHGGNIASIVRSVYEAYFQEQLIKNNPEYVASSETFKKYVTENPYNEKQNNEIAEYKKSQNKQN